ncbi:hypothetical protein ACFY2J_34105 [Streptomyces collinus]|uniref:hypothetical protein n=1 Tax=Streptomyces collinus TaxID=42684 RepID=UPI0036A64C5E
MSLRDIARSLKPGNDRELADDLSTQRRAAHRRSVPSTAQAGQDWEDTDRAKDRKGGWRITDWGRS